MTIKFYEYGNSVMFGKRELSSEQLFWDGRISAGDNVLYHDSKNGTRPMGHVISLSENREYLLVRLASYEMFIVLRRVHKSDYIVLKSDIRDMIGTSGKAYYEGDAELLNVHWELDPSGRQHIVFVWYMHEEKKLHADVVALDKCTDEAQDGADDGLVDYISGRFEVSD